VEYQRININQVEASHARSIGAEALSLHAITTYINTLPMYSSVLVSV